MDARYAAAYPDLYARHWWWRVREQVLLGTIGRLLADVPDARILDVGCGAALFFDALERFGHVEGIESDRAAVEQSGRWQSRVTIGDLDEAFVPKMPFDLVLMLDVLEHVLTPEEMLKRAREILRPNGHILITVPAFNWLWTSHDDMNHHVTRYSAGTLRRVVEGAGFTVSRTSYLFQSLIVPKLLVRLKERWFSRDPSVPQIPTPGANALLEAWFKTEHFAMGWLPFGASVVALASPGTKTFRP